MPLGGIGMYLIELETLHIRRPSLINVYVNGYKQADTYTEFDIKANVQPVYGIGGRSDLGTNIIQDPNSDRDNQGIIIHTTVALNPKDFVNRAYDGKIYEILHVEPWTPYPAVSPLNSPDMQCTNWRCVAQLCEDGI